MRAREPVAGHLAGLGRGDQQEVAGVGHLEIAESELGLGGGRADLAQRIVAAGVEHDDLLFGPGQRLQHFVHQHAARDLLALAIDIRVDWGEHVAFGGLHAVARVEHEGEGGVLRFGLELADCGGKPVAGEVEAARPLAVAGDRVEAALAEELREALRVGARIVECVQLLIRVVADDQRHALVRCCLCCRDEAEQKCADEKSNAHARLPEYFPRRWRKLA